MSGRKRTSIEERFWEKVDKTEACWNWTGYISNHGSGAFVIGTKRYLPYRVSWEFINGPIPKGMQVCHKCDNRKCVRPDHLWLGTQKDNVQDMIEKGRQSTFDKTSIRGELCGNSKLNSKQVLEIREHRKNNTLDSKEISKMYNISRTHVYWIWHKKVWNHI